VLSKIIFGISQLAHFRPLFYTPPSSPRARCNSGHATRGTSWYSQKYLAMVQAGQMGHAASRRSSEVFDVMLHAESPPRAEGPSPVLPPQLHAKKAVTGTILQFANPFSQLQIPPCTATARKNAASERAYQLGGLRQRYVPDVDNSPTARVSLKLQKRPTTSRMQV
jgi:hypothetical protein